MVERKLEVAEAHAHRLAGLVCFGDEGANGWAAMEGAGDGSYRTFSGHLLDNCTTRLVEPILWNGGCVTCGDRPNVEKWAKVLDNLSGSNGTSMRGLPPVGVGRVHRGIADPDDALVAQEVVPHLPPGSPSMVTCEPNCNSAERVAAWLRLIDEEKAVTEDLTTGRQSGIVVEKAGVNRSTWFPRQTSSSLEVVFGG